MTAREVTLDGGSPWGFRMHGGVDVQQPLRISRVNPGSKAAAKGVREGDIITSINGENTRDRTNTEAHALLKGAGSTLKLGLNQDCSGGSPKKRQYNSNNKSVQQEAHSETIKRSNTTTTTYILSSSTTTNTSSSTTAKNQTETEFGGPNGLSNDRIGLGRDNNEYNGIRINGESKPNVKDYFSDRSTISSNYSSAASTPSTLTEYQVGDELASPQDPRATVSEDSANVMADNASSNSRSSKRRSRRSNNINNRRRGKGNERAVETVRPLTAPVIHATIPADSERLCDHVDESKTENHVYRVESPKTVRKSPKRKGSITKSRSLDDDDQVKIQELSESESEDKLHPQCNAIVIEADSEDVQWEITTDLVIGNVRPQHIRTMTTETLRLEEKIPPTVISPEDESDLRYFLEGLDLVTSAEEAARKTQERETAETIRARRAKKREELAQYFLPVYQNPRFLDVISEEGSDLSDREQKDRVHYENFATMSKRTILTETDSAKIPVISDTCTMSLAEASVSSDVEIVYLESSDSESIDESDDYADIEEETNETIISIPSSQLTPPPTPDDVSPKNSDDLAEFIRETATHIVDEDCESLRKSLRDVRFKYLPLDLQQRIYQMNLVEIPIQRINVVSPSVLSDCSGASSSRGTSMCTTIFKEEEAYVSHLLSLRELCLKKLISLPFGKDVLEELASVSRSLQDLTNNLSSRKHVVEYYHHSNNQNNSPSPPALTTTTFTENPDILTSERNLTSSTNPSFDMVSAKAKKAMPERAKDNRDKWVGMSSEEDPQLVVCLSPTQKSFLDTTKKIPDEAAKLLDLHEKFTSRRQCHETPIKITDDSSEMSNNRLLAIIREAGSSGKNNNGTGSVNRIENPDDYLYFVEKRNDKVKIARSNSLEEASNDSARLKAHNLSEWLRLARDKSRSDPHLNIFDDTKEIIAVNLPKVSGQVARRRRSLPQEFYVQQMQYLIQKEKEIQQELEKLEEEKRKLTSEINENQREFDPSKYHISKNQDIAIHNDELQIKSSKSTPSTEKFRQDMYDEYMSQIAKRQDRQQNKVIKITSHQIQSPPERALEKLEAVHVKGIEDEFMSKVKQRKQKYGINSEDTDYTSYEKSDAEDSEPVLVMDGDQLSEAKKLPKHLKEFVDIARQAAGALDKDTEDGIWSPGLRDFSSPEGQSSQDQERDGEPIAPVWTPKSAGSSPSLERKEFRPVNFESPILGRKNKSDGSVDSTPIDPPWRSPIGSSDLGAALASSLEKRIPNSFSAPLSGFADFPSPRLPKAQNPTITLLQKARGGHLPKGAAYIDQIDGTSHQMKHDSPPRLAPGEIVYEIKNEYTSESESDRPKKMADLSQRKYNTGIGPTTKDGMPLTLRSEVRDQNQSKWYKRMYDTIHKQKPRYDDEYVTVKYKQRRGRYPYSSGYLSEPEPGAYDSDVSIYDHRVTPLDRRRTQPAASGGGESYTTSYTMPRNSTNSYTPQSTTVKHGKDIYKNQPGRIENYIPGHSSVSDKEAKEWWDEVMDIFDGHLEQQKRTPNKGYLSQALKESGYESDSTLIFRRRDENINQLSPSEQREAYRTIQKGGDVPLHGLRKLAPERPKESPRKYVENEVTIHYRTPVRQEIKEALSEDELQRRQAEHMKKIYQEERRRKYLQVSHSLDELQDMNSRRHADNFIPSQKSPIPLNRYDDFVDDLSPKLKPRPRSPEPRLVAKALYNFVGQSARELTFRKGDIIYIRRQVDKNWYEGEHNAMVGLFPANYVEIVPYDGIKSTVRKPHEGQARAKYNFIAQTHLELSLAKGELVVVTRRVDDNWFEGKIGGRKGIFPVSYVEVLIDPSDPPQVPPPAKPVAAPAAHSLLLNGSLSGKESMGSHRYVPPPFHSTDGTPSYRAKPVQMTGGGTYGSLSRSRNLNQALHIDTQSDPIPYRALYKYKPQNEDELELLEGDTVYVLEKCDDGWFVGSSDRTGAFGTFPGNYVERI